MILNCVIEVFATDFIICHSLTDVILEIVQICPVALALVWKSSSILKETAAFSAVVIIFLMISEAWLNLGDSVPAVTFVH